MSLISPRHVCSKCDGYIGSQFRNLSSKCDCPESSIDDELDAMREAREHSTDPDESRAHLND